MIPQNEEDVEYLTRGDRRPQRYNSQSGGSPDEHGCNKDYPFADILPKDEAYIDFLKNKEVVGIAVNDIGMKCSSVMNFVHNLKNYYPEELLKNNIEGLQNSVTSLNSALTELQEYLLAREKLAREVLKSGSTWIRRSL
jgi:hypothetical protein